MSNKKKDSYVTRLGKNLVESSEKFQDAFAELLSSESKKINAIIDCLQHSNQKLSEDELEKLNTLLNKTMTLINDVEKTNSKKLLIGLTTLEKTNCLEHNLSNIKKEQPYRDKTDKIEQNFAQNERDITTKKNMPKELNPKVDKPINKGSIKSDCPIPKSVIYHTSIDSEYELNQLSNANENVNNEAEHKNKNQFTSPKDIYPPIGKATCKATSKATCIDIYNESENLHDYSQEFSNHSKNVYEPSHEVTPDNSMQMSSNTNNDYNDSYNSNYNTNNNYNNSYNNQCSGSYNNQYNDTSPQNTDINYAAHDNNYVQTKRAYTSIQENNYNSNNDVDSLIETYDYFKQYYKEE